MAWLGGIDSLQPNFPYLGYVWNPESTKERKKITKENDFSCLVSLVENIKENQIYQNFSKLYMFLNFLVLI